MTTNKLQTPSPIAKKSKYIRIASRYGFTYNNSKAKPNLGSQGNRKVKISLATVKALGK